MFGKIIDIYPYIISTVIMLVGLYMSIMHNNLLKKVFGLIIFQNAIILFYICFSTLEKARPPIFNPKYDFYVNPLPHVLMLTAIVVGLATTALACALIIKIKENFNTIEEGEINPIEDD